MMLLIIILGIYVAGTLLGIFIIEAIGSHDDDLKVIPFVWPFALATLIIISPFVMASALGKLFYKKRTGK